MLMERLQVELCLKIFCFLDHQNLAVAQQVCRKWKDLASDDILWANLFRDRWGEDQASFYAPTKLNSWKHVYEVQDRCDRLGLGLRIIREGVDYYLIYQGEIQQHLGSSRPRNGLHHAREFSAPSDFNGEVLPQEERPPSYDILEKILFFIGDLEVALVEAKRSRTV
ncbi:hypothetical protein Nepgr_010707 [Nepenthes gracilis]|uniref:F-box protein n=1 Tax=Nepenthes gracilis TaxID=150966 RepID=A0AAD3SDY5_NEPGR|nr:hypothetical protein Nepgr_010707 [Nepenthes gracilis]